LRKKTISNKCALYQRLCHGHCDPVQPASMWLSQPRLQHNFYSKTLVSLDPWKSD
jgi:hypothetical protein